MVGCVRLCLSVTHVPVYDGSNYHRIIRVRLNGSKEDAKRMCQCLQ